MPIEKNIKNWKQHYSCLTEEERSDPIEALIVICYLDTLFQQRSDLWVLFSAAMSSNRFRLDTPEKKRDWMFFYEKVLHLLEAAHRIDELIKKKKLRYSYSKDI